MRLNISEDDEDIVSDPIPVDDGGETLCQSDPASTDPPCPWSSCPLVLLPVPLTSRELPLQVTRELRQYFAPVLHATVHFFGGKHQKFLSIFNSIKGPNCLNSW